MKFKTWSEVEENLSENNKSFHQITWYIDRPLNLKEWSELDNKMSDVLHSFVGDEFVGFAGPIPFDDWYEEAMKIYKSEK